MADGGGSAPARGRTDRLYSSAQGGWGKVFLRTKGTKSGYGSWHGRSTARRGGGDVRRVRRRAVGWVARRRYSGTVAHGCEARGAKGVGRNGGSTAHGPAGRRLPRRSDPRGWIAVSARDAARRDATSCRAALWLKDILSTPLRIEFTQFFQTELQQGLTTKVAHLTTLYKFCNSSRVLGQRICHKLQGNLTEISALVNSESRH
jgi:hypothetical protein